jgi:hypothetical protein
MTSNFSNYDMRNLLVSAFRTRAFAELVLFLSSSLPRPAAPVPCSAAMEQSRRKLCDNTAMRFASQLCVPLVQGRGSFGAVYLCIDKREGRKCVGSSLTTPGRTGHAEPTRTIH